jgi:hypothetical protein
MRGLARGYGGGVGGCRLESGARAEVREREELVRMGAQGVEEGDGCNMRRGRVVPVCGDAGQHRYQRQGGDAVE